MAKEPTEAEAFAAASSELENNPQGERETLAMSDDGGLTAGLEINVPTLTFEQLAGMSIDSHMALNYVDVIAPDELVGVPFVIFGVEFHDSKQYGGKFVSVHVKTRDERVGIVNSGAEYGIYGAVQQAGEDGRLQLPILVSKGLKLDEYKNKDDIAVTTYRFA